MPFSDKEVLVVGDGMSPTALFRNRASGVLSGAASLDSTMQEVFICRSMASDHAAGSREELRTRES